VIPAVTMTFGGVEIDAECCVLERNDEPIPGLYAAGGDASDIYHRGYAGGLCAGTGRPGSHARPEGPQSRRERRARGS
jgi:predicted oxidoreductase